MMYQTRNQFLAMLGGLGITAIIFIVTLTLNGARELGQLENIDGIPYPDVPLTTVEQPTAEQVRNLIPPRNTSKQKTQPVNLSILHSIERFIGEASQGENIKVGQRAASIQVTERLAHADVYLSQPGLFKELELSVTFTPHNLEQLAVGVRDDAFWLSYEPTLLFQRNRLDNSASSITRTVTIPLTDKLQDGDQSVDVMFIATPAKTDPINSEGGLEVAAVEAWITNRVSDQSYWELHDIEAHVRTRIPRSLRDWLGVGDWLLSILRRERPI